MNLVETIKHEVFSGGLVDQLGSLIGAGEGATKSAVGAAVPALLSALSRMASGSGADKLASALNRFDAGAVGDMAKHPAALMEQGSGLLGSLFNASTISAIVNVLSKFSNIAPGAVQKLLGFLMPLVMGAVMKGLGGKAPSAQGLANLFAEQKANIADAMPAGLSLRDIPGLDTAKAAVQSAGRAAQDAGSSAMNWLLPLIGLVALGLLLWFMFGQKPAGPAPEKATTPEKPAAVERPEATNPAPPKLEVPDVGSLSKDLSGVLSSLTDTLGGIKDTASADAAMPKLKEISDKVDGASAAAAKLTDAGKSTIRSLVAPALDKLRELVKTVLAIPGVGDKIRPVVEAIMSRLTALAS
jgi:hypothetical protein